MTYLFFDVRSDVLLNIEFLERLPCHLNGFMLHLLRHVGIFYHGFTAPVTHGCLHEEYELMREVRKAHGLKVGLNVVSLA